MATSTASRIRICSVLKQNVQDGVVGGESCRLTSCAKFTALNVRVGSPGLADDPRATHRATIYGRLDGRVVPHLHV